MTFLSPRIPREARNITKNISFLFPRIPREARAIDRQNPGLALQLGLARGSFRIRGKKDRNRRVVQRPHA
jgi:hypothetical protein